MTIPQDNESRQRSCQNILRHQPNPLKTENWTDVFWRDPRPSKQLRAALSTIPPGRRLDRRRNRGPGTRGMRIRGVRKWLSSYCRFALIDKAASQPSSVVCIVGVVVLRSLLSKEAPAYPPWLGLLCRRAALAFRSLCTVARKAQSELFGSYVSPSSGSSLR